MDLTEAEDIKKTWQEYWSGLPFPPPSPFYCFPLFLCFDCWGRLSYLSLLFFGTLHSDGNIFSFLLCLSLLFFSQPPKTIAVPFCISFSWGWSWLLLLVQCHEPSSIILQALCLSDLISWIDLSLPLYNHKGFDLGHTGMVFLLFPTFLNLILNLSIRSSWSEPQSAPGLIFAD